MSEPTLLRHQLPEDQPVRLEPVPEHKRRRFSRDTVNDLLFWGFHLMIVGISLAIMWIKVDKLSVAVTKLLVAQAKELEIVQQQLLTAQAQAVTAQQAEHTRSLQFSAATSVLNTVVNKASAIQDDVGKTLAQIQEINQSMLKVTSQSAAASQSAANAAQSAANAAGAAANTSASTRSLVARKVVTTQDKIDLDEQRRALAAKQKQLTRVIKNTKVRGPTIFQKIFGQ